MLDETGTFFSAPTVSPPKVTADANPAHGANPYRQDLRPQLSQPVFDFDLDLNPDL